MTHYALLGLAVLNIALALVNVRNARRNVRNAEANVKASERLAATTTIHLEMAKVDGALIMKSLNRHRKSQGRGSL